MVLPGTLITLTSLSHFILKIWQKIDVIDSWYLIMQMTSLSETLDERSMNIRVIIIHHYSVRVAENEFNSSPPSAAYMRQWIGSPLVQIMDYRTWNSAEWRPFCISWGGGGVDYYFQEIHYHRKILYFNKSAKCFIYETFCAFVKIEEFFICCVLFWFVGSAVDSQGLFTLIGHGIFFEQCQGCNPTVCGQIDKWKMQ